jgi:hypothetical protein
MSRRSSGYPSTRRPLLLVTLVVAALVLGVFGCAGLSAGGTASATATRRSVTSTTIDSALILGRWIDPKTGTGYEFKENKAMVVIVKGSERPGTYKISGNELTLAAGDVTLSATFAIEGDSLVITQEGLPPTTLKKARQ